MSTNPASQRPQVGVGVIVLRNGQVLLGKRMGSHGAGTWGFPGGHLEFGESIEAYARREVLEEAGLTLGQVMPGLYTNDILVEERKHYVTCCVWAKALEGELRVMEPAKCECWAWFSWDSFPVDLFRPVANLVGSGFVPSST